MKLRDHFVYAETELNNTGVTRQLIWAVYKEQYPEGYNYSHYRYHLKLTIICSRPRVPGALQLPIFLKTHFAGKELSYVDTNHIHPGGSTCQNIECSKPQMPPKRRRVNKTGKVCQPKQEWCVNLNKNSVSTEAGIYRIALKE